jgi:Protein of unknown function (DUF2911)
MLFLLTALVVAPPATSAPDPLSCITMNTQHLPLATRKSPLDSVSFKVGTADVKVCYGRPSARGRTIFGGLVPYGRLWRTGANEPTMIHTSGPITVAGVAIPAGSYSLYTVPGEHSWDIIVNKSITQWGIESDYTAAVKSQEVGHGTGTVTMLASPVDTFTIRAEPSAADAKAIVLEWEKTGVRVALGGR